MKKVTALVTGVGGTPGQSVMKGLRISKVPCRIVGLDAEPMSAGLYRADAAYIMPFANTKEYIPRLIDICNKEKVQIVMVASTPEVPVIAKNKKLIENGTDAVVLTSDSKIVDMCADKYLTYRFLKDGGFRYPETADAGDSEDVGRLIDKCGFPLILKPNEGCAAKGVFKIDSREMLKRLHNPKKPSVLQEYLEPDDEEYTAGLFFDSKSKCQGTIAMKRELVAGGTYRGIVDDYKEINKDLRKVAFALKAKGPINFQFRLTSRGPVIFEINPRFSCSDGMRAQMGYNAPEAAVRHFVLGEPDISSSLKWRTGVSMRYMNEVLVSIKDYERMRQDGHLDSPRSRLFEGF
ncbi:MAG: ATP-grasp domain-containing protein [Methanobacteriota archaeon]